jgi:hypothetical protein
MPPSAAFEDVVQLYENSSKTKITKHRVSHETLGMFCLALYEFEKRLGELSQEDYWLKYLIPLKRLRFGLCAAPFPQKYRQQRSASIISSLRQDIRNCNQIYPDFAEGAFAVTSKLEPLVGEIRDPLLAKLVELTPLDERIAWVIKESRLIPDVEKVVTELGNVNPDVIHPSQLKQVIHYDQLVVVGPSRWFPESVFTASRAKQIHIVLFDWIRDRWRPNDVFVKPHRSSGFSSRSKIVADLQPVDSRWASMDAETLLNIVDKSVAIKPELAAASNDEHYDDVEAVCVFLEGDWALFIDTDEDSKTLIIDLDEDEDDRIARVPVKAIKPGTFVLVRTGGGGDFVVPLANKIMSSQAPIMRKYQRHWKSLLQLYVKEHGIFKTSIDLLDRGSQIANEGNVRNWMSSRSIRTQKLEDFAAIMQLVGLQAKTQEYWHAMGVIFKAHRKAGFEIRRLLIEQVKEINISDLQKHGKMEFRLAEDDESSLTAFRVESLLGEPVQVPYLRIGQPFQLEKR